MNKRYHLLITFLLLASIVMVQGTEFSGHSGSSEEAKNNTSIVLPTYEGIKAYESNKTVYLDSMSTEQKISLMTETWRLEEDRIREEEVIGGFHLGGLGSRESTAGTIENLSDDREIRPFISMDMEGCDNPISGFMESKSVDEIKDRSSARELGEKHGEHLRDVGVTINYAPVMDVNDTIWNCRSFEGDYRSVSRKGCGYIRGIQSEGVMATAKHFPGETLTDKDPHDKIRQVNLTSEDVYPFKKAVDCNTSAIMISHQITTGVIDSEGKPASASPEVVETLRENYSFGGLIVTDAINMGGLDKYYENQSNKYVDVFQAGNDFILNLAGGKKEKRELIDTVSRSVESGEIDEARIDSSVTRLLNAQGWTVRSGNDTVSPEQSGFANIHSLKE